MTTPTHRMPNRKPRHRVPVDSKHEYEVQRGSSHSAGMLFVGHRESTAVRKAVELMAEGNTFAGETHVRLYHSYPSPGPQRRYVGVIKADGTVGRPA